MSSHHVNAWVLDHSEAKAGERLVLLSLASFCATDDWEAFPSIKRIAEHCRMSDRGVRYALRSLEAAGRLLRKGISQYDTTIYQIRTDAQADEDDRRKRLGGLDIAGGEESSPLKNATESASQISPEPEVEPEDSFVTQEGPQLSLVREAALNEMADDAAVLLKRKTKVGARLVTADEMEIAVAALGAWNVQSGQSLSIGTRKHLSAIVGRIREHPSWDAAKFVRLVESAWKIRWWERSGSGKRPTVYVIFSPDSFPNVVQDAVDQARGKAVDGRTPARGEFVRTAPGSML